MKQAIGIPGRRVRTAAAALLIVAALAAQAGAQRAFETRWPRAGVEQFLYLPSGRNTKALTLGFSNIAADVLWIRAVGYFGGHVVTDNEYPWLFRILEQVTALDPPFTHAYLFGGTALALKSETVDESMAMLSRGMKYYPGDWRYPMYLGFNAFYNKHEPERAAGLLFYAASLPGSPYYLPRLAASLLAKTGRVDAAIQMLEAMAEGTTDEGAKLLILHKIEDLRANRLSDSLRNFLTGEGGP
jgi:hypothetical protein